MIKSAAQSSLLNDTRYTSMSAGVVPSSEYLISTTVLTQNEPSVTFDVSSFAGVYKHLQIVAVTRDTQNNTLENFRLYINGVTSASYAFHILYGTGSAVESYGEANTSYILGGVSPANSATASAFGASIIDILDPYSATKNTTVRSFAGATTTIRLYSGLYNNTAAVSSLELRTAANFVAGSRFSIYGVTA